jgi:hypothetical protein
MNMIMIRLALAWLVGALVGAIIAAGISLLAFAYPVRTEISNFPLDDAGNIKVAGSIETRLAVQATGSDDVSTDGMLGSLDGQGLYCFCSQPR